MIRMVVEDGGNLTLNLFGNDTPRRRSANGKRSNLTVNGNEKPRQWSGWKGKPTVMTGINSNCGYLTVIAVKQR